MPQEPKRRHSRGRQGKRRSAIKLELPQTSLCPQCGKQKLPHIVCKSCGYYKGRRVI